MNIFQSLAQWREERGLQNQIGNVAGNICEELTMYVINYLQKLNYLSVKMMKYLLATKKNRSLMGSAK